MIKISCDYCDNHLSITTNCISYGIKVENFDIPCIEGKTTFLWQSRHFEKSPLHFCNIECLRMFIHDK